jgi:hypothetical protein
MTSGETPKHYHPELIKHYERLREQAEDEAMKGGAEQVVLFTPEQKENARQEMDQSEIVTVEKGRLLFEEYFLPTKMFSAKRQAYEDYTELQKNALELIETSRTHDFRGTQYDKTSKMIVRGQRGYLGYDDAYAMVTAIANKWRPAVTRGISDDYEAQSKFVDELIGVQNQNLRRLVRQNRAR